MAQSEDPEDMDIFAELMKPIADLGALQLIEDRLEVSGELTVVPAPGHTPGHQVVLIESSGQRAIVAGDTANHPVQVPLPGVASGTDTDPELAVRTRTDLLGRAESEDRLFVTGHFPEPFGRIVTEDGIRSFHSG
jgi:glyoxylase-like metal-dependent hydrolase (beta-lactamase superfamily II)